MKAIILILIIFFYLNSYNYCETVSKSISYERKPDTLENYLLNTIKKYESFRPDKYTLFGHKTIGYGHVILKTDTLYYLTEIEAYNVLKNDFQKRIKLARKLAPKSKKEHYLLIACLLFNCKNKPIIKSDLVKMINSQSPDCLIKKEFLKFHYIGGKPHKRLLERRIDESKILSEYWLIQ